ncbi:MAG: SpoIIE family protein phosphatase [Acidobacteriota bacterium]|nr:MAG: SpoIIE family protein phosphatase [Acidobacteriota bacterium]
MLSRCVDLRDCGLFRVLDVTRRLSAPIALGEMLQLVIEAALETLQAERGTVFLFDPKTDELYSKVATGTQEIRFPSKQGIAGETAQTRSLINVPDCYADPRFNQEIDKKTGFHTRCLLSIPLIGLDDLLVGVLQVLNKKDGVFTLEDERVSDTLAAQCAVALQRALLIEERLVKQKLEQDLAVARDIQQAVLPKEVPSIEGYSVACWSRPADDSCGDIYDAVEIDGTRMALLLGDATGHGIGPALSVTQMRAMFRLGLRMGGQLDAITKQINEQLKVDLPGNRFITSFFGILDAEEGQVEYLSYGQGPLIHYHAQTGEVEFLESSGLPMGIPLNIPSTVPAPMKMDPGDVVAIITDGFFEYANLSEEQFGNDRVAQVIREFKGNSMQDLLTTLLNEINRFAGDAPQDDDMTAILVKRCN